MQNVSDIIKSLLQIPGWPLHMILSGVPTLARFLTRQDDGQLRNRSYLLHLRPITEENEELVLELQEQIMESMGVGVTKTETGTNTPEFMKRLTYSCSGALGTMIKRMQAAATEAVLEAKMSDLQSDLPLADAKVTVTLEHYATVYELQTGASDDQNLFLQDNWNTISPLAPLEEIVSDLPEEDGRSLKKKKTR